MKHGEKLNTITHFIATLFVFPAMIYLIVLASQTGDVWKITSVSIYGTTLFLLYFSSAFYHAHNGRFKYLLQKLDHISIYLLIAGTYTPFMLVTLHGAWGWSIFGVVWGLAVIGIALDIFAKQTEKANKRILQLIIYLVMGWIVIIPIGVLAEKLASGGMTLLALGGIFYTVGVIFYVLDYRLKHAHGIWHLFVIGGSASHYAAIIVYVV